MRPFNSANVVINLPSLLGNDHSNDLYVCLRLDKFVNWFSNLLLAQKWPIYPRIRPLWKLIQGIDSRKDQSILNSPSSKTLIHFETYLFFLKSYRQRLFKLTPFNDIDDLSSLKIFCKRILLIYRLLKKSFQIYFSSKCLTLRIDVRFHSKFILFVFGYLASVNVFRKMIR